MKLPPSTAVRLGCVDGLWRLCLTAPGSEPLPGFATARQADVVTLLVFVAGCTRLDRRGAQMVETSLQEGIPVVLSFEGGLSDAMCCQQRLGLAP